MKHYIIILLGLIAYTQMQAQVTFPEMEKAFNAIKNAKNEILQISMQERHGIERVTQNGDTVHWSAESTTLTLRNTEKIQSLFENLKSACWKIKDKKVNQIAEMKIEIGAGEVVPKTGETAIPSSNSNNKVAYVYNITFTKDPKSPDNCITLDNTKNNIILIMSQPDKRILTQTIYAAEWKHLADYTYTCSIHKLIVDRELINKNTLKQGTLDQQLVSSQQAINYDNSEQIRRLQFYTDKFIQAPSTLILDVYKTEIEAANLTLSAANDCADMIKRMQIAISDRWKYQKENLQLMDISRLIDKQIAQYSDAFKSVLSIIDMFNKETDIGNKLLIINMMEAHIKKAKFNDVERAKVRELIIRLRDSDITPSFQNGWVQVLSLM